MGKGRIEIFKSDNKDHLELLNKFIKENKSINLDMSKILGNESDDIEINDYLLYIIDNQIKDICYVNSLKDIKMSTISLPIDSPKNKKILIYATNYAIDILGMKQIFIKTSENDQRTQEFLEEQGYENLGIEKGNIIFLKEVYEDFKKSSTNNL